MMKLEEIKTIVELMSEHDLSEFRIDSNDMQLAITRGSKAPVVFAQQPMVAAPAPVAAPASAPVAAPAVAPAATPASTANLNTIDSPTVGTFYRSSSPDSAPFVSVGDRVNEDTVVCIVEAMKVMNEIKAEKCGVIKEILVENAQPIEFGQALFVIE